jgi:hypothetical protein
VTDGFHEIPAVIRFLTTDPADVGCEETMELMDVYAELILAGKDPEDHLPGVTAHLRDCHPCAEDLEGLIAAAGPS